MKHEERGVDAARMMSICVTRNAVTAVCMDTVRPQHESCGCNFFRVKVMDGTPIHSSVGGTFGAPIAGDKSGMSFSECCTGCLEAFWTLRELLSIRQLGRGGSGYWDAESLVNLHK